MVFYWSLSDSNSPHVSRTFLSILVVLNNTVVWMVSSCPPTSKSSSPFSNPLVTVPKAPITIGIIVTCMFHSFSNSLARSRYLSFFSHSFSFILWSAGTAKSTILQVLFFFFFDYNCLVFWPRLVDSFVWYYYYYYYYYYYNYYYYYSLIRAFYISVSRWFFTGVWVTASLFKSPGFFLVFWPFSIMLSFEWSPLIRQFPSPPVPLVIL